MSAREATVEDALIARGSEEASRPEKSVVAHAGDEAAYRHPWKPVAPRRPGLLGRLALLAVTPPHRVFWLLRELWPIARIGKWLTIVSRYDDVAEVLSRYDAFSVPWPNRIRILNDGDAPGTPFILGIDDRKKHAADLQGVMQAFRRSDIASLVVPQCADHAEAIVASAVAERKSGTREVRIEAVGGLISRVALNLCGSYYGVRVPNDDQFLFWTLAVSGDLFGWPPFDDRPKPEAEAGAERVRRVLDQAIDAAVQVRVSGQRSQFDTVLARLIDTNLALLAPQSTPETQEQVRKRIRSFLMGMIVGFVPTNTMAGGHILEVLLDCPEALRRARDAALAGDDGLLGRCLLEALRFRPINPGPFRFCASDYALAQGTERARTIPAGSRILAATMSAMFDRRRVADAERFDPVRPAAHYMHFGYGLHWCVGAHIAEAHLTQTFKALLRHPGLERVGGGKGKMRYFSAFPAGLDVRFEV